MLPRLGLIAREAIKDASEGVLAVAKRTKYTGAQAGGRYSPLQFGKEAPRDVSDIWQKKSPFIEGVCVWH